VFGFPCSSPQKIMNRFLSELYQPGGQRDMSRKPTSKKTHKELRPMTQSAIERAALADPDARPLSSTELKRMKRTPQAKIIRRALGMTQEEFSTRYHIPLGTLRDWEQGRATPDQPTQAYLTVIARSPEGVQQALEG
jgi:putative transcriptional regulator